MKTEDKIEEAREESLTIFVDDNRLYSKYSETVINNVKFHFDAKWIKEEKYWELNLSASDKRMDFTIEFRMGEFKSQLERKGYKFI